MKIADSPKELFLVLYIIEDKDTQNGTCVPQSWNKQIPSYHSYVCTKSKKHILIGGLSSEVKNKCRVDGLSDLVLHYNI